MHDLHGSAANTRVKVLEINKPVRCDEGEGLMIGYLDDQNSYPYPYSVDFYNSKLYLKNGRGCQFGTEIICLIYILFLGYILIYVPSYHRLGSIKYQRCMGLR